MYSPFLIRHIFGTMAGGGIKSNAAFRFRLPYGRYRVLTVPPGLWLTPGGIGIFDQPCSMFIRVLVGLELQPSVFAH